MDLSSSAELTEPTAEFVQLSKSLAEMQSSDAESHDAAEVRIPWRGSSLPPHPHRSRLLQRRGVFSLRIWLSGRRSLTWRSRSLGQVSLLRADSLVIVSPTPAWCDVQECISTA